MSKSKKAEALVRTHFKSTFYKPGTMLNTFKYYTI